MGAWCSFPLFFHFLGLVANSVTGLAEIVLWLPAAVIGTVVLRVCLDCSISLLQLPILRSYCRQSVGRRQFTAALITIEMKIESGLAKLAFNWFADVKDTNRKTDLMVKCQHYHWRFVPVRLSRHSIGGYNWSIISNVCLFDHGDCLSTSINETPP